VFNFSLKHKNEIIRSTLQLPVGLWHCDARLLPRKQ